jgi:hypothetical protein
MPVPDGTPPPSLPFLSLHSALMWPARHTRHDLLYALVFLGKFTASFTTEIFTRGLCHVLRYALRTADLALVIKRQEPENQHILQVFSDSDYASDYVGARRSYGGSVVTLFGNVVDVHTRRQTVVATSVTEAEYIAASDALKDYLFLYFMLSTYLTILAGSPVFVDNKGAVFNAQNPSNGQRSKHIDVRYHFIRDYTARRVIVVRHIPGVDNIADLFTKVLFGALLCKFRDMFLSVPPG